VCVCVCVCVCEQAYTSNVSACAAGAQSAAIAIASNAQAIPRIHYYVVEKNVQITNVSACSDRCERCDHNNTMHRLLPRHTSNRI